MAVVLLQVIPSFFINYPKNTILYSEKANEKYIVSKEYCSDHHNDKMCFLPNCRCQNTLIGDNKDLLQKMDGLCINYQHMNCLYALLKYKFSGKNVVKSEQFFDKVQRAVHFDHQKRGVHIMPSIAKKGLLMKNYRENIC